MTEHLDVAGNTLAYEVTGQGPLVVLAHGMGDSRHAYRFLVPKLAEAGYRVANLDIRGSGDSSLGWDGYSRTDIAGDLLALVRHLGGPAVIVGHSISGGAATIAAATAPELIAGVVELAPFTRKQSIDLGGLLRVQRYRAGYLQLAKVLMLGSLPSWQRYLDIAYPTKPADWDSELARIEAKLREPGRMQVLQAMGKSNPSDAGARLSDVRSPTLIIEGSSDPDWADPGAEGKQIVAELLEGLGELEVIEGVGHYPHVQAPDLVGKLVLPFLAKTLTNA
ncbi:alpha/beta fold hydrolase [Actinoalloteichus hymeniacidonis]|uniref:Hydrolase or acyltransferase of alpha/beta superfamily n=1 Tax=Actinoalloteichus hymeniacidonis TaxID=340345 RepID=A0AAC9HS14_9PSEU|nr:alpha/beta hydrolase [Actinoalloteichus hymeniacidonis]AOS64519.1 putative hydrolase or acyltransferase of alpha/beta superfamily [Actinoalloteichus hymeniacidonis]MBB5907409.1 pimeloyl-ACP methyl ester carboxylesterase [Actinoalloteichus hymeniacidonis]